MSDFDALIDAAGRKYNVDPRLIKTVSLLESSGNPNAPDSETGAQGLMQIEPATAAGLGVNAKDPGQAIDGAARYLAEGLQATGSPEGALAYYHGGPNQQNWGPKTAAYVARGQSIYPNVSVSGGQAVAQDADVSAGEAAFKALTGGGQQAQQASKAPADADVAAGQQAFAALTQGAAPEQPAQAQAAGYQDPEAAGLAGVAPAAGRVLGAAAEGAKEGFGSAPVDLFDPVGLIGRGANALIGGASGVLDQTAKELPAAPVEGGGFFQKSAASLLNPTLARGDVTAIPDAFAGSPGALATPNRLTTPEAAPAAEAKAIEAPSPIPAERVPEAPEGAQAPGPQPGMGPRPDSMGAAAASPDEASLTPEQVRAYRSTAEMQKLNEAQPSNVSDPTIYVKGVSPTAAEIEQSVNTSRELKALKLTSPEVSQEARDIAAQNNEARQLHFQQIAGSPVDLEAADAERSAQAEKDLAETWANKQPANPQPVADAAEQILASPDGRRPLVRSVIGSVMEQMQGPDGQLLTDPEQLYGVRKHIDDILSEQDAAGKPKNVRAQASLLEIKSALDNAIEQAAPGFKQYLQNFSDASKRIDEMQVLQKMEPQLYDAQGRMTFAKVQGAMRQIVKARQATGINPYQSISDQTMQGLFDLRDDLRRAASAEELARTPGGSDTAQNMVDVLRQYGKAGANLATHSAAAAALGPVGPLAVNAVKGIAEPIRAAKAQRQAAARAQQLLHPDPSKLRNRLIEGP